MLTPAQLKAFTKGLGCANEARAKVEWLQKFAEVYAPIKDQVDELSARLDHLQLMCETAIAADQEMG